LETSLLDEEEADQNEDVQAALELYLALKAQEALEFVLLDEPIQAVDGEVYEDMREKARHALESVLAMASSDGDQYPENALSEDVRIKAHHAIEAVLMMEARDQTQNTHDLPQLAMKAQGALEALIFDRTIDEALEDMPELAMDEQVAPEAPLSEMQLLMRSLDLLNESLGGASQRDEPSHLALGLPPALFDEAPSGLEALLLDEVNQQPEDELAMVLKAKESLEALLLDELPSQIPTGPNVGQTVLDNQVQAQGGSAETILAGEALERNRVLRKLALKARSAMESLLLDEEQDETQRMPSQPIEAQGTIETQKESQAMPSLAVDAQGAAEALSETQNKSPAVPSPVVEAQSAAEAPSETQTESQALPSPVVEAQGAIVEPSPPDQTVTMVGFLPLDVNGVRVFTQETASMWRVTVSISAAAKGIAYRRSKKLGDKINYIAHWEALINGTDEGDGWLRCEWQAVAPQVEPQAVAPQVEPQIVTRCGVCKLGHELEKMPPISNGWACDGRDEAWGCKSGITNYFQTTGLERYECRICNFDLCTKCHDFLVINKPADWRVPVPPPGSRPGTAAESQLGAGSEDRTAEKKKANPRFGVAVSLSGAVGSVRSRFLKRHTQTETS